MTTYNRVVTGVLYRDGRYYLTLMYQNSETGERMDQLATRWFTTQAAAEQAAEMLAREVVARLQEPS